MEDRRDLIIVGGGVIASSIAYNLLHDGYTGSVLVLEKDPLYEYASTPRSAGGIRQIFSTRVNIEMSQYGLSVYQRFAQEMGINGEPTEIDFKQRGYLFLLTQEMLTAMQPQIQLQKSLGVDVQVLTPQETLGLIPELNTADLAASVFSPKDGYMDPYSVMQGYIKQAKHLGAQYVYETVTSLAVDEQGRMLGVKTQGGDLYRAPIVINACGAWSGDLSQTIGANLPVKPLRRQVFHFDPAIPLKKPLPLVVDKSGVYFRHEGPKVIAGLSNDVPYAYDFHWEKSFFESEIWPVLADRCPNFERVKLERGWAGLYDYNVVDHNGIVGAHPQVEGYYVATGFSGHGLQHAPAVGKSMSELIRLGRFETVDVSVLSPARFATHRLVVEDAIV
ncbi:FAD-binding oxidoreductase [Alicyclobacillus tolerans]|uniref:NAD(P)/FAD-dependent oxidoreductase n=1 Tax=Alicyclobacillus tolerans TaxID=90970 RepID=UPI001F2FE8C3|nr:FAD-binding oxidoreductase [Alicyclobacillus tolerans]MCF8566515.1 FAD-binding oxidoreductase [Alicyclobacillus tolerans]